MKLAAALLAAPIAAIAGPAITVYNQDFALVRDTVPLDLKAGENAVAYANMTAQLEPDSVVLRDPAGKAGFQILEQSYRNDPVSQTLLLSMFEGQELDFFIRQPQKPDVTVRGKVLRSGHGARGHSTEPVIEMNGAIRFGLPGEPVFPALKDEAALNPTLHWVIRSKADAKLDAEIAYITGGFTWEASYNLVAPEKGNLVDLVGWVTISNRSGKTFKDASVKLMAGDVNKIQPPAAVSALFMPAGASRWGKMEEKTVTEKSFDEFHLYTVARPMTLRDQETKQVEFVHAAAVKTERIYVYDGANLDGWRTGMAIGEADYGPSSDKKVNVFRQFMNTEENMLGIPLPKGRVRFYQQDDDGQLEFIGENTVDHTPKNERIRVYVGDAFDLVGERLRTDWKVQSSERWATESLEIKVRNRKDEPAEIRVVEHLFRWLQWEITKKSADFEKLDAQTVEFRVPLKPDEEKTVTYTVRYTW